MSVIITAGMIGVGKTTLTEMLAKHLDSKPFFEPVEENPILERYYEDPKRFGFDLQIYFLNQRFKMIKKALADDNNVLDRSIYEDALFTLENYSQGNMLKEEYDIYLDLLDNMMGEINDGAKKRPDLLVFLDADFDTILSRIQKRGRVFEQLDVNPELRDYYHRIWSRYRNWFDEYDISPKMRVDLTQYDLSNKEDQKIVLKQIDEKIANLK